MKTFVDFDDVLFCTKDFLDAMRHVFRDHGVSGELFLSSYKSLRAGRDNFCYTFEDHIKTIEEGIIDDKKELLNQLQWLASNGKQFLFPDVQSLLSKLQSAGHEVYILSFGDNVFQRQKIEGALGKEWTEKIFLTQTTKVEALVQRGFDTDTEGVFFDDRVEFLEQVKKTFPKIRTVLVQRPDGRFFDTPNEWVDERIESLSEYKSV